MTLSDAHLHSIEDNLKRLVKPTTTEIQAMVSELRASRTAIRALNGVVNDVVKAHATLGDALHKAGEVR